MVSQLSTSTIDLINRVLYSYCKTYCIPDMYLFFQSAAAAAAGLCDAILLLLLQQLLLFVIVYRMAKAAAGSLSLIPSSVFFLFNIFL